MNSWQMKERADFYMDRTRNARFSFYQYAVAFREVQMWFFDKYKKDDVGIRDNLYSLINIVNPAITTIGTPSLANDLTVNHINYPTDYHFFSNLSNYIDGNLIESKPTNYNQLDNILLDAFRKPSNERCYVLEDSTGWRIYRGYGGVYTNELTYLVSPSDWYIGTETDLIDAGPSVLTPGTNYTATAESEIFGTKYEPGEQFVAFSPLLSSGQVIPTSVLVNSNLPDTVHEEISRIAAYVMQGSVSDLQKAGFIGNFYQSDGK